MGFAVLAKSYESVTGVIEEASTTSDLRLTTYDLLDFAPRTAAATPSVYPAFAASL
jgi:hypothetical protein